MATLILNPNNVYVTRAWGANDRGETVDVASASTTSSANTTFTETRVTDASAWDLSSVEKGMIAVASNGSKGVITSVNDGSNFVVVESWSGEDPSNGDTVTITWHQITNNETKNTVKIAKGGKFEMNYSNSVIELPRPFSKGNHPEQVTAGVLALNDLVDFTYFVDLLKMKKVIHLQGQLAEENSVTAYSKREQLLILMRKGGSVRIVNFSDGNYEIFSGAITNLLINETAGRYTAESSVDDEGVKYDVSLTLLEGVQR